MFKLKRRSGIVIPREYENEYFYGAVKNDLTRTSQDYNTSELVTSTFYNESDKSLVIPRYFPIQKFCSCEIEDYSHEGETIEWFRHTITPRNKTQEQAIEYMMNNDKGIIQLQPGVGKTIISIYIIVKRAKKSFILVHRDSLVQQWKEKFLQFTNLKDEDVVRLSSNKFEEDLKKPIIIATNQTFMSLLKRKPLEFLTAINNANIGIFIGDEVHTTVGAPSFSMCSIHIPAKVTFGLSATPYRYDGNGDVIEHHLGEIFELDDSEGTLNPRVNVLLMDFMVDTPNRYKYLRWGGRFQRSRYLNLIKNSQFFMSVIKGILNKFIKDERNFLCVCERIKLIDLLYDNIKFNSKSKFVAGIGNEALTSKAVFTTPGKCRDGVDAAWKDTLIMTSPISNIAQMVGRIVRSYKDKGQPIIIDMIDIGCPEIRKTFHTRRTYYLKKGYDIKYIFLNEGGIKRLVEEDEVMKILKGE